MMRCAFYRNLLTAAILAGEDPGWPLASHTGNCIRCQAHVASLRTTRRRLAELGQEQIRTPQGYELNIMESLGTSPSLRSVRPRWARAASASVAATLLAVFWIRRRATARA